MLWPMQQNLACQLAIYHIIIGRRFHLCCPTTSSALFSSTPFTSTDAKPRPQVENYPVLDESDIEYISGKSNVVPMDPTTVSRDEEEAGKVTYKRDFSEEGKEEEVSDVPEKDQKSLRMAIIGAPNSGKSTLINHLLGQKVGINDW